MTALRLTAHARARMRQRAIPPLAVEALFAYGRRPQAPIFAKG